MVTYPTKGSFCVKLGVHERNAENHMVIKLEKQSKKFTDTYLLGLSTIETMMYLMATCIYIDITIFIYMLSIFGPASSTGLVTSTWNYYSETLYHQYKSLSGKSIRL